MRALYTGLAACLVLSACAPSPEAASTAAFPRSMSVEWPTHPPTASSPALVFSPYGRGREIVLFDRLYQQYKTVQWTSGPEGGGVVAFDSDANLYLADEGTPTPSGHDVLIFHPPYSAPPVKLSVGATHIAAGIAIDKENSVFAVVAIGSTASQDTRVVFFKTGQTVPCATVSLGNGLFDRGGAFDAEGSLFVAEFTGGGYLHFISIAGKCNPQKPIVYSPTFRDTVADWEFNPSDDFVVDTGIIGVQTYAHPRDGAFGQPLKTITLGKANGQYVYMDAISQDGKSIFAIPYVGRNAYLYHYPAGGAPFKTIPTNTSEGTLAINPPEVP